MTRSLEHSAERSAETMELKPAIKRQSIDEYQRKRQAKAQFKQQTTATRFLL
jgi:hypothetical protein